MIEGYEELVKSLLEKEVTAPDESIQDPKRNAIASLIPMAAGVLTGQVGQGAQLGLNAYKTMEDQRSKSRGKLLDYLAKMKKDSSKDDWQMKDTDNGIVMYNQRTGEMKNTGMQPFQKDASSNWQQVGGTNYATFFRKNPEKDTPEIFSTDIKIEKPVSPYIDIASRRLEEDIKEREERKIQKYSEDTEPLRKLEAPLAEIESYINKNGSNDLPGVGAIDIQLGKLGLKGSLTDPKLNPEEAAFVNAVKTMIANKSFSEGGKALSVIENQLITGGIGLLEKGGEENFRQGVKQIREGLNSAYSNMKAKYPKDVSSKYSARGGSETTTTTRFANKRKRSIDEIRTEKAAIEAELNKLKGKK